MNLKLLCISLCFAFYCSKAIVFSQEIADTVTTEENEENLDDGNLTDSTLKETIVMPFDTNAVPAASLYKCWSNSFVDPYDVDLTKKADTTFIDLSGYVHPITGRINSDFGWRKWRWHYGTDIKLRIGDTIHCSFDGLVRIAKRSRSFGNYIVVRHYNGLETIYGHLSKICVNVNQPVKAGETIGLGGSTGHSTGPHLHYEVRFLGNNITPNDIVDFQNSRLKSDSLFLCQKQFEYINEIRKIRYHIVRKGDTLGRISLRYGTSINNLCRLNKITRTKLLRIGQRIRYT